MYKNSAAQQLAVYAWDGAAAAPKTGDAAQMTATISLDGAAPLATNDLNPTELDAINQPGVYIFDLTQAETNADHVLLVALSSTADVIIDPVAIYTRTSATVGDVNVTQVGGVAVTGPNDFKADTTGLSTFDSVTDPVTVGTNNDKTGYEIAGIKTRLDDLGDITVADILAGAIDGATLETVLEILLASAQGRLVKSGDSYTYYKQDNLTTLWTNTLVGDERTRT